MAALICGSMAFDNIAVFPGRFKDHILAEHLHVLNVSFLIPEIRQSYGGCAGNIAYSLKLLGAEAYPMATVGKDFDAYEDWLNKQEISCKYIRKFDRSYTARAFIITDMDDNQITAFHPGAMERCHEIDVPADAGIRLGLVSPEGKEGMLLHARQFVDAGVPYIFDPGQGAPMFSQQELEFFVEHAEWLACNDYELKIILEKTGMTVERLAQRVAALFVTYGSDGSSIYVSGSRIEIEPVRVDKIVDPTGCGDAYRAGLIYGMLNGMDWRTAGRIASLMGAVQAECNGTQQHFFTPEEFAARFERVFGHAF